jgi:molybdopterin synthase sulfur carrier subunit
VRLDGMLREFIPRRSVEASAPTVGALIDELEARYPKIRWRLRDETGTIRRFVKVFVNGEEVGGPQAQATPLQASDEVDILHSIAGG